jgi:HAE1 family hydrophobic/amphiphilic exporter-1
VVATTPFFLGRLGGEFIPAEDEGSFQVVIKTPIGSSLAYGDERMRSIENIILSRSEVKSVFATLGGGRSGAVNQGVMYIDMKDRAERDLSQQELMAVLREELAVLPGVQAFPAAFSFAGSARGEQLQFALQGPDLASVARLAGELRDRMAAIPEFGNVDLDLNLDLPQIRVEVNRDLAAELGFSTRVIAEAANVLAGGLNVAKYSDEPGDGERYDIRRSTLPWSCAARQRRSISSSCRASCLRKPAMSSLSRPAGTRLSTWRSFSSRRRPISRPRMMSLRAKSMPERSSRGSGSV